MSKAIPGAIPSVLAALCCATVLLSGCGMFGDEGMFRNRGSDYLEAEAVPPIVVPENLDSETLGQLYVVPPISQTATLAEDTTTVPRPQPLSENLLEEQVKIQSYAGQRWILINRNPSEVWPRVRNILNRSGIPATRADASQGVLETGWLEFKQQDDNNHRYRFSIEPGVQLDSTEIKVLHDQKPKGDEDSSSGWPDASVSDEQEKSMVEILANALAGDLSSGSVSLLAQSIGGSSKVDILTPKVADPYMLIKLNYDRAWASVSYSVGKGGFTTVDQDRSGGIFYVHYQAEPEEKGFLSRWFGGDEEDELLRVNYQVNLRTAGEGVEVRVTGPEGESLNRNEALRLLKVVRANLS